VQSLKSAFQRIFVAHFAPEFTDEPTKVPYTYGRFNRDSYLRNLLFRFEQFVIQLIDQYFSVWISHLTLPPILIGYLVRPVSSLTTA
jgi:hypothetical protein